MIAILYIAVVLISYLLGSIPFGLFIGKAFVGTDIRQIGSGKIGMTNVMRAAGKKAAALSLLLDMGKSALAVWCARLIFTSPYGVSLGINSWKESAMVLAGLSAIGGHTWSVFLRFRGGRGVGTFIGGLLVMYWQAAVIGGGLMLLIGIRTKYMSMGSIIGAVTAFMILLLFGIWQKPFLGSYPNFVYVLYAMIGSIFIYVIHRDNIIRLFNGTERKIDEKTNPGETPPSCTPKLDNPQ